MIMKKTPKNMLAVAIMTIAVGVLFYQVAISANAEKPQEAVTPVMRPIPTVQVKPYVQVQKISFPGHVQASSRVALAFNVDGQIVEMSVPEGAHYKKGDILAKLDQRDFQNNYAAAEANARRFEKEFNRIEKLLVKEVVSQAEYDSAKSAHDVAQAELNIRGKAMDDTVLRAPFDGVVAKRFAENYQHIKEKDNIFSFKDISSVEVAVQVPERIVARTSFSTVGLVEVSFDADRGHHYPARTKEFSLQSDPVTRTYQLVVDVTAPETLNIFPGMTATVFVEINSIDSGDVKEPGENVFVVPVEAVFADGRHSYCWVIPSEGGNPEKRQIEIGVHNNQGILLLSGMNAGESVATAGLAFLHESLLVRPLAVNWEGLDG